MYQVYHKVHNERAYGTYIWEKEVLVQQELDKAGKGKFPAKKADQCVLWQQLQEDALYTNHSVGDYQEVLYFQTKGIDGLQDMDYYSSQVIYSLNDMFSESEGEAVAVDRGSAH